MPLHSKMSSLFRSESDDAESTKASSPSSPNSHSSPPALPPLPTTNSWSHHLPAPEPTVLTWNPQDPQPYDPEGRLAAQARQLETVAVPVIENDNPPDYLVAQKPIKNIVYSFSPLGLNTMLLMPPADAADTRPKYCISVGSNCFAPTSFVTTLYRGGSTNGELVGDFEMGLSAIRPKFLIRGKEFFLGEVLSRSGPTIKATWDWRFVKKGLLWDCKIAGTSGGGRCLSRDRKTTFAIWTPTPLHEKRSPGTPVVLPRLEVTPAGQDMFDDIVLSLLIIERYRLIPEMSETM
ncbi:hypothetical protein C8J56DRAFT_920254 [Mycena floridula]|nr:hypothetical protein C8J56DRAFT_920254 [Mycena floridula]